MQKTLVVHHRSGIGDLVWHLPYIRAIAATSAGGKVTVMARPSCMAEDILSGEPCVDRVIRYDRRPRSGKKGHHDTMRGQFQLWRELRKEKFDRIIIFSNRPRYGVLAWLAGIPVRSGFGFDLAQRLFLNQPPYIQRFNGEGSWVYPEATDFSIKQGFVDRPVVPKMMVPESLVTEAASRLEGLSRPRLALAIGSSVPEKNWGHEKFVALTKALVARGWGVLILGGPGEKTLAEQLFPQAAADTQPGSVYVMCQGSVLKSAAALKNCDFCIGNDTGILNVAVAVDVPALGLFGATRPLAHDPLMHGVSGADMHSITVNAVLDRLDEVIAVAAPAISKH
ncbi:MAG TPA: glycosyltransferase family 9 protein [Oxalicibacterium sp.]|jgi:heptosyltransferase-2|nr:glycosyltransferase family 9 protein [Oxalicibacterium sp.]